MIVGIDLGNALIKTSEEVFYPNKLTTDERLYTDDTQRIRVEFDDIRYVAGEGEYKTDYNKVNKKDNLINLYTAIALSTEDRINQVVIGLPVQQYKTDKELIKNMVMDNRIKVLQLNGARREIMITDVEVFPEGLATFYTLGANEINKSRDTILIDIGGRTTDISLYAIDKGKRKLKNYITIPTGTLNIYSDFVKAINDNYGLDKLKEDAEDIISNGLWVDGEKVNLGFTKDIFVKYADRVLSELKLNYPVRTAQSVLCGGGGRLFQGLIRKEIKDLYVVKDIFSNAKGLKEVGESKWSRI